MGMAALSLRGRKPEEVESDEEKMVSWRAPLAVRRYIKQEMARSGRTQAAIINEALELDRDLGEKLEAETVRIATFAASIGLSVDADTAEIVARLVRAGLDATAAHPEKKPKK